MAEKHANVTPGADDRPIGPDSDIRMFDDEGACSAAKPKRGETYCSRVTWTSTNIREVPEPEKMPERGLTSL